MTTATNPIRDFTMLSLVTQRLEHAEQLRLERIHGAKTNLQYLMAAGVVISCDDAQDNAYRWRHHEDIAKAAGVSHALVEAAAEYAQIADGIIAELKRTAEQGETSEEHGARVRAAAAEQVGFQKGKKKPCRHNETKRERGLMRMGSNALGGQRWGCCRCGVTFEVPDRPATPTDEARRAATLYARLANVKES